jgi:hypothetical protein
MIWTKKAEWGWGASALTPASGWMAGGANLIWLLVGRCARGGQVTPEAHKFRRRRTSPTTAECASSAYDHIVFA